MSKQNLAERRAEITTRFPSEALKAAVDLWFLCRIWVPLTLWPEVSLRHGQLAVPPALSRSLLDSYSEWGDLARLEHEIATTELVGRGVPGIWSRGLDGGLARRALVAEPEAQESRVRDAIRLIGLWRQPSAAEAASLTNVDESG